MLEWLSPVLDEEQMSAGLIGGFNLKQVDRCDHGNSYSDDQVHLETKVGMIISRIR